MKLNEYINDIQYVYAGDYFELPDGAIEQAEEILNLADLRLKGPDEFETFAMLGDQVVGVLYNGNYGDEITSSIAVHPDYRRSGIAAGLFNMIDLNQYYNGETEEITHVLELVPPYTLENFVIQRGYKFMGLDSGKRIYHKQIPIWG